MRFKALRHQPSDAARKSGYDNEGQLPDTLPDSRSRPEAADRCARLADCFRLIEVVQLGNVGVCWSPVQSLRQGFYTGTHHFGLQPKLRIRTT